MIDCRMKSDDLKMLLFSKNKGVSWFYEMKKKILNIYFYFYIDVVGINVE